MADDVIVDFLHVEIVRLLYNNAENDPKEESLTKLEQVGYSAGYRLAERLTRDWPRFKDELDTMKYICKDFWVSVFKKQIDNLRTNYQGVYALQDNEFRFLARMPAGKQQLDAAPRYVALACGILRGALANLGLQSLVTAEVAEIPACKFCSVPGKWNPIRYMYCNPIIFSQALRHGGPYTDTHLLVFFSSMLYNLIYWT